MGFSIKRIKNLNSKSEVDYYQVTLIKTYLNRKLPERRPRFQLRTVVLGKDKFIFKQSTFQLLLVITKNYLHLNKRRAPYA